MYYLCINIQCHVINVSKLLLLLCVTEHNLISSFKPYKQENSEVFVSIIIYIHSTVINCTLPYMKPLNIVNVVLLIINTTDSLLRVFLVMQVTIM